MKSIRSRVPAAEYHALHGVSITRLKEILRSPQHYAWILDHPRQSEAMTLGTAAHTAVLEPERFMEQFAVWGERTSNGRVRPRQGGDWEDFKAENIKKVIITPEQDILAKNMSAAVRSTPAAMCYLESGDPEVTMQWMLRGHECRGRVDWLAIGAGTPITVACIVGLKTTRDCRRFIFGSSAARLGYHLQWAWYHDGYKTITSIKPRMVEIVVESAPPHAVAVYRVKDDLIDLGREEYLRALDRLDECDSTGVFPGPQEEEEELTLPAWAYPSSDDITELELEAE